jgi:hypothetical protein
MYQVAQSVLAAQLGDGAHALITAGAITSTGRSINGVPLFDMDAARALVGSMPPTTKIEPEPSDEDNIALQYAAFISLSADAYAANLPGDELPYTSDEIEELIFLAGKSSEEAIADIRDLGEARILYARLVELMVLDCCEGVDNETGESIIANAGKTMEDFEADVRLAQARQRFAAFQEGCA